MRRALLVGLIGIAVFLAMHPQMLGYGGEATYPGWDVIRVFWADLAQARRALASGELPLWNPYDRGGYSFIAEPQSACFDPVTWGLVALALALGSTPPALITLKTLIYFGIAAAGIDAFLRARRLPNWACALGALIFVACPRLDKLKDQSALWPAAWTGWVFLALYHFIREPSPRRGLWLGLALSLLFLSGYPPSVFRLSLVLVPWAGWLLAVTLRSRVDRRGYGRRLVVAGALASLVVVGFCTAQFVATASALSGTERASLGLAHILATRTELIHALGFAGAFSETPSLLVYIGGAGTIAFGLAWIRRPRAEWIVLAAVGVFAFLLACGKHFPLLEYLARLPGFGDFRIAGHYLTLSVTCFSLLAPMSLAALDHNVGRRTRFGAATLTVSLTLCLLILSPPRGSVYVVAVGLVGTSILGILGVFDRKGREPWLSPPIFGWCLVLASAADLYAAGRPIATMMRPYPDPAPQDELVGAMQDPGAYRVADLEWACNRIGPCLGVRDLGGHRPAFTDPRYRKVFEAAANSGRLLAAMNVELVARKKRLPILPERSLERLRPHRYFYRVKDPWPLVYWTQRVVRVEGANAVLEELQRGGEPRAVFEEEFVDPAILAKWGELEEPAAEVARSWVQRNNSIELQVDTPGPAWVVVADNAAPGWSAWVDGRPAPVVRVNLIQRAVAVSGGSHVVRMRYAPPFFYPGLALFGLTALGVGAGLWVTRRRP